MSTLGNILWILFGGFLLSIYYAIYGLILCITIIGIPFGIQMFKMAGLALCPFGRDVEIMAKGGCVNTLFNIIWIVTGWWEIAILHLVLGLMCAITINHLRNLSDIIIFAVSALRHAVSSHCRRKIMQ